MSRGGYASWIITDVKIFIYNHMRGRLGLERKLSTKEVMLLNGGVGEDSWESLGLQGDPTTLS